MRQIREINMLLETDHFLKEMTEGEKLRRHLLNIACLRLGWGCKLGLLGKGLLHRRTEQRGYNSMDDKKPQCGRKQQRNKPPPPRDVYPSPSELRHSFHTE